VETPVIIYGDPFDCAESDGKWVWQYREEAMSLQYAAPSRKVWRAELDVPARRRMKYGFRARSAFFRYDCPEGWYFSENGTVPFSEDELAVYHNHFFYPYIHTADAPAVPQWAGKTVWYQIFPDRFRNGDPAISLPGASDWERDEPAYNNFFGGDLEGIRQKLGYLKELGISGIYLTPIFQSPSNHKYDTEDYFRIDERFGSTESLKALVREAHALNIRVMLDAVFNHTGSSHPFWRDVLANQERSEYRDCFYIHNFPVEERCRDRKKINYECFAFSSRMPKWNTENPRVKEYLIGAALHWIRECDIDAWRLDVANEVSFDFWREFSAAVHREKKDFYVIGEVWNDASPWINPGYFDAAMNYPLGMAVSGFFLQKNTDAEDVTERLIRALTRYSDLHNRIAFNLMDSHDPDRALTRARGSKSALRNAFTMLFLMPGSPCIYYGTEIGMTGGQDPQCRRPMIWNEEKQDRDLLAFFQRLIRFRAEHLDLINNSAMLYTCREGVHCWTFSGTNAVAQGGSLTLIYPKEKPVSIESLLPAFGEPMFSAAENAPSTPPDTNVSDGAAVLPGSAVVFYRKSPKTIL
jgi:glycosidase